jgi:4-amino-4-deoxy-L-arabinose transferase-like glycosyltransferase
LASIIKRLDKWRVSLIVFAAVYGLILTIQLSTNSVMWDEVTHFTGGLLLSRGQVVTWVLTNSLYPPIFDIFTAFYYLIVGPNVFAGRLVAVTFCVLSIFLIYEFTRRLYNQKTAFLSAALFSVMPGIVWLSRMAMIETLLIFVFTLCLLYFYSWLTTGRERDRKISIVLFAIGVAVKYQTLVIVPLIMVLGMFIWKRTYLKDQLKSCFHMPRIAFIAVALSAAAVAFFELLFSGVLDVLFFALQTGTAQKAVFSARYPVPLFYFVEMTWFDNLIHPISLLLYALGLSGLGLMIARRKTADKFLLVWFAVILVVFTLIPNREWRYVTIAFPVLAIAAAAFLTTSLGKLQAIWQTSNGGFTRKWGTKTAAVLLVAFTFTGGYLSCADAYNWVTKTQVAVPVDQAVYFAADSLAENQSVVVACPVNRFNQYLLRYHLSVKNPDLLNYSQAWQYPAEALDAYTLDFDVSYFSQQCREHNAKYVLLYEFSGYRYFNSNITAETIYSMLNSTGSFRLQATFGVPPDRMFVFSFTG